MPKLNLDSLARYNKFFAAALAAALEAAQTALPLTELEHGWVTVALAAIGALGVAAIPNKPAPAPAAEQPVPPAAS